MGSIINYTKAILKQKFAHPVKAILLFLLPLFLFFGAVGAGKAIYKKRETEDVRVSKHHILLTVATLSFYIFYTVTAAYDVVKEKQILRKQHMLANGLGKLKFFLAWTLAYTILMLPTMIVMMIVVYILKIFPHVNIIVQFIDMLLFQISGITVAFWVSASIPIPIIAAIVVFIFNTSFTGAYFGMAYIPDNIKETLCLFISPMTIGTIINNFQHVEIRGHSISLGNIIPFRGGEYNVWANTFKLILNNVLYITLGLAQDKLFNHLKKNAAERKMEQKFASQAARSVSNKTVRSGESKFSAEKVFKSYFNKKNGTADSLNNVNLEIQKGEIFAVAGTKGSGKSTFLKLLASREVPSYGNVNYSCPTGLSQLEILSTLGSVAPEDDYVLFEEASVADNINLYASILKNNIDGFELLRELNYNGSNASKYNKLDDVEKNKVKAAIALMCNKDVLIFDEPTKDMSENDRISFWKLVKSMKNNKTVVFSTTSLQEAANYSDRAVVLENGQVASIGKVEVGDNKILIKEEQLQVKVEC